MGNAIISRDRFDKSKDVHEKLGILYDTDMEILRILKGKRLDAKTILGGVAGGFLAIIMKLAIWR